MDPREKTWELAQSDIKAALEFAENIADDWYRVQSLAAVAWHTKQKTRFMKTVDKALAAARKLPEPNRTVACSAWVVRAMAQRDDIDLLPAVNDLLEIIAREPNPVRRGHALFLLFESVYRKQALRQLVLGPLLEACMGMKSWKQPRTLSDLALTLAGDDLPAAEKIVELIGTAPVKRKTKESIANREWLGPHEFFPNYSKMHTIPEAKLVR